jgi:hypothetical protein
VQGWLQQYANAIFWAPQEVEYLLLAGQITHSFPAMQAARGDKEKADAWVVALAGHMRSNPQDWRVVCDETSARRPNKKIPAACERFGVPCTSLMEMLRAEFPEEDW